MECTDKFFLMKSTNNYNIPLKLPNNRWFKIECREAQQQVKVNY